MKRIHVQSLLMVMLLTLLTIATSQAAFADTTAPEAGKFIGINGGACLYTNFADAIADASDSDELYVDPGSYIDTIGLINKDLTFFPARVGSNCKQKHATPTSGTVVVDGGGVSNAPQGGMMQIDGKVKATFEHMWLRNTTATNGGVASVTNGGALVLDDVLVTDGTAVALGGLFYVAGGDRPSALNLINGTNVYRGETTAGDGGAIAIFNSTLNIEDDSGVGVSSNNGFSTAGNNGGGIYADGATINIRDDANVIWNVAGNYGGGIYANNTDINIFGGNISNNSTLFSGGGIYIEGTGSDLDVENATFDNNATTMQQTNQGGGAVFADQVSTTFTSVSIINNDSSNSGGGIYLNSSSPNLIQNSTISDNTAIGGAGVMVARSSADLTVINTTFDSNIASGSGGGIQCFVCGEVTIQSGSEINSNQAKFGGGLRVIGGGASPHVKIEDSTFTGNKAIGDSESKGGGIYEDEATMLITNTIFTLNEATVSGGGLYASDVNDRGNAVTVTDSFFDRNKTTTQMTNEGGGGIYAKDSGWTLTIENSDFSANETANLGGGLAALQVTDIIIRNSQFDGNDGGSIGGALYNSSRNLLIEDSSFTNNFVSSSGGGSYHVGGTSTVLRNVEISGNTARWGGGMRLANTTMTLENVKVNNNIATETGGGIYAASTTFKMTVDSATCNPFNLGANVYCSEIRGNSATEEGGGFYNISSTQSQISQKIAIIEHTAIMENTAPLGGTAVYLDGRLDSGTLMTPTLRITNTLIADNGTVGDDSTTVENTGEGILSLHSVTIAGNNDSPLWAGESIGETDLYNSILYLNSEGPRVTFGHDFDSSCNNSQPTSGSSQSMGGSLGNPQFDPSNSRGGYRLTAASPGVDSCASGPAKDTDLGGRPSGSSYDQGAFELSSAPTAVGMSSQGAYGGGRASVSIILLVLVGLTEVVWFRPKQSRPC